MKKLLLASLVLQLGMNCIAQNGIKKFALPAIANKFKTCISSDIQGNTWIGYGNSGVQKFNAPSATWMSYDTSNSGICSNRVKCITIDNAGNTWIGTENGLSKFDGFNWTTYTSSNSNLICNTITCLELKGNDLFIGTTSGLSIFNGSTWTPYNTANSGLVCDTIRSIAFGNSGELWIGTDGGISLFQNSNWTNYIYSSLTPYVKLRNVQKLLVDNSNTLYLISDAKLFKLSSGIMVGSTCGTNTFPFSDNSNLGLVNGLYKIGNDIFISHHNSDNLGITWHPTTLKYSCKLSNVSQQNSFEGKRIPIQNANYSLSPYYFWNMPAPSFNSISTFGYVFNSGSLRDSLYLYDDAANTSHNIGNPLDTYLDINEVNAKMLNQGDMCWDLKDVGYEVPKCSKKNSIFASALWIGGYDNLGLLHTAAMTYRQTGIDFWPGPLDTVNGTADLASFEDYNKIWKINRYDIEQFKSNFLSGNVANGSFAIPLAILDWPAQGTGNHSRKLAPFFDFNGDGIYNPHHGDYPVIKGDQELFWIYNDAFDIHSESEGSPLGIEVHTSAYAYTCDQLAYSDSDNVLNYTTFYNHKIINRSHETYHDVYVGIWMDPDLGNPNDDLVGCDSALNAGFVYNSTNDDSGNGENKYGINPPMQNNLILKGPRANPNDGIDNDRNGIIDEPGESLAMTNFMFYRNDFGNMGNPSSAIHYYNFLKSKWRNSIHTTYGVDGYGGMTATNYMYSGTPYLLNSWVQTISTDGRMICSMGPFTLAPGEEQTVDNAFVFSWDSTHANGLTTSIAKNKADLKRVQHWFLGDSYPSCLNLGTIGTREMQAFSIFPNPTHQNLTISSSSKAGGSYFIFDMMGKLIDKGDWEGNTFLINTSNYKSGIYLIRISSEAKTSSMKFVKE